MIQSWMTVRVAAKQREATDIYSFELIDPQGRDLPPFSAGAHIDVELAPDLVRQYSLCNHPEERNRYVIGILREPASRGGSVMMIDRIEVGHSIRVSEPRNHFPLQAGVGRSLLIAGGIGITPILCMAERLSNLGQPFEMHYGSRSADRMAFQGRIKGSAFADKVSFHFDDGPGDQKLNLPQVLAGPRPGDHLYVCGPGGLIEAVLSTAKAQGWPDSQVHREFFAPVVNANAPALESGAFDVKLASSGDVFTIPADRSITDVLADAGIQIPISCEQGVCGTCLTAVLQGTPDHRDFYLTPDEQANNDQILPCCSRAKTPMLVLDL